ncbi:lytic transglycosylase domain-containing protein [Candidatus Poribacteria bacterium]|nr:lytic transglycosylase domain-containing protein [Candidatus Poribacteria bacterium]MYG05317.1 lytic transglycosylase domain-containing protein [Candidatus Poribacteria bacterium]MYK22826.1 lytic transglycosylase domain-containing protein [Candidatus Poribacteria bacterium]
MKNQLSTLPYRKWGLLLVAAAFLLFSYFLGQKSTSSDPINLRPEVGTRGIGLGGAFISSADDATSPLWNPAGLATLQRGNLIYDLSQGAVSLAYPIKPIGTFGVNFLDLNGGDRFLSDHVANPIGSFELGNNQALFSYARKFGPLQLGASTGYSRAAYYGSRWAQNYDIGVLTALNTHFAVGIRLRDISGVTIRHRNGQVLQTFDQQLALGAVLTPHPLIRWHNRLDITPLCLGTSLEIGSDTIAARVGSTFTFGDEAPPQSWSLGFSLNQLGKQLHYTYLNQENLEHKHLVSIGMSFGTTQPISHKPEAVVLSAPQTPISKSATETEKREQPKFTDTAVQIAKQYDIDVDLMLAIIYAESNFNLIAVSKNGAGGLMQMMPETARELGLTVPKYQDKRKPKLDSYIDERFDPHKNLHAGLTYFKRLLEKYRGNLTLALGAYNIGPGKVKVAGPLISSGKKYANKVLSRSQHYRDNAAQMEADLKRLEALLN